MVYGDVWSKFSATYQVSAINLMSAMLLLAIEIMAKTTHTAWLYGNGNFLLTSLWGSLK